MTMNNTEPTIHVGILTSPTISFVLNGSFMASNGKTYTGKHNAKCKKSQVLFDKEFTDEIIFEPQSEDASFDLINVVIGINFHWERKENQRFKGALKLIVDNKQLIAINHISVENYLTSVISSEMSATASDELLKAHAVISRSWLLNPIVKTHGHASQPLIDIGHEPHDTKNDAVGVETHSRASLHYQDLFCIISSAISLNLYFCILPLAVIGNSSTKKMYLGILKRAICPRQ